MYPERGRCAQALRNIGKPDAIIGLALGAGLACPSGHIRIGVRRAGRRRVVAARRAGDAVLALGAGQRAARRAGAVVARGAVCGAPRGLIMPQTSDWSSITRNPLPVEEFTTYRTLSSKEKHLFIVKAVASILLKPVISIKSSRQGSKLFGT